jgi:hypothetical protein
MDAASVPGPWTSFAAVQRSGSRLAIVLACVARGASTVTRILGISGSLRAGQAFDENGALKDQAVRGQLPKFVAGFAAFARADVRGA